MSDPAKLYRHFDADGALLYVGVSLNAIARLSGHETSSEWSGKIARVEIESFESRAAAENAEEMAIRNERPAYNVHHTAGRKLVGKTATEQNECRRVRERLGLSQRAFADLMGVKQPTVWRWENGKRRIKAHHEMAFRELERTHSNEAKDETTDASTELDAG